MATIRKRGKRLSSAKHRLAEDNERDPLEHFTQDMRDKLLAACKAHEEPSLYALVRTAMVTGARAGELLSLRWRDVDLDNGLVRLRKTKNGDKRPARPWSC